MDSSRRILVLGHRGLLGSALMRRLQDEGYAPREGGRIQTYPDAVRVIGDAEYVFVAAGVGGGIKKNLERPADLAYATNRLLQSTLMAAAIVGVRRLIWFACACVYPRLDRPATEEDLWARPPEPTSLAFAAAQLAAIELTRALNAQSRTELLALCPPTLYGLGDDFSEYGHVLASMIRKIHEAKMKGKPEVTFWGSGRQRRQFLYVDTLAHVAVDVMWRGDHQQGPLLNVATEGARPLDEVSALVAKIVGYEGGILWDPTRPEGAPRKEIRNGSVPISVPMPFEIGVQKTYDWYVATQALPTGQHPGVADDA